MPQNSEKSSNIAKIVGKKENLAGFSVILTATFGTKNVHSAVVDWFTFGAIL